VISSIHCHCLASLIEYDSACTGQDTSDQNPSPGLVQPIPLLDQTARTPLHIRVNLEFILAIHKRNNRIPQMLRWRPDESLQIRQPSSTVATNLYTALWYSFSRRARTQTRQRNPLTKHRKLNSPLVLLKTVSANGGPDPAVTAAKTYSHRRSGDRNARYPKHSTEISMLGLANCAPRT